MKSREEQLSWAKQRAFICVDMGGFSEAVAGLRAGLAENPLTKGVVSSEHACAHGGSQIARRRRRGHGTGSNAAEPSRRVASKLARPQRFFNHLRMLTATSR